MRRNYEAAQRGRNVTGLWPLLWVWVVYLALLQGAGLQIDIEGAMDGSISVREAIMQRREQTAGRLVQRACQMAPSHSTRVRDQSPRAAESFHS